MAFSQATSGGSASGMAPRFPPFPPPDIDLQAWLDSIKRMRACHPTYIYPTHFGIKNDGVAHFDSLEENIHRIAAWVREKIESGGTEEALVPRFQGFMHELLSGYGLQDEAIQDYEIADPAFMSVYGLARYWKRHASGRPLA